MLKLRICCQAFVTKKGRLFLTGNLVSWGRTEKCNGWVNIWNPLGTTWLYSQLRSTNKLLFVRRSSGCKTWSLMSMLIFILTIDISIYLKICKLPVLKQLKLISNIDYIGLHDWSVITSRHRVVKFNVHAF